LHISERDFRLYCADILDSGKAILEFVKGLKFEEFCKDRKTYSAVIREFEIIGEAAGKLPDEPRRSHPHIAWQDIKDFRNLLTHEYFGVDLEIVWKIIQEDLPDLMAAVREILAEKIFSLFRAKLTPLCALRAFAVQNEVKNLTASRSTPVFAVQCSFVPCSSQDSYLFTNVPLGHV